MVNRKSIQFCFFWFLALQLLIVSSCSGTSSSETSLAFVPLRALVVSIDGRVAEIGYDGSACDADNWNTDGDGCRCCLVKTKSQDESQSAEQIINSCSQQSFCSPTLITQVKSEESSQALANDALVSLLYDKLVITRYAAADQSLLNSGGVFTESSLRSFLATAYTNKQLKLPEFRDANCMTAKNILGSGGFNTVQLFAVNSVCTGTPTPFIIKEAKDGIGETLKLATIKEFDPITPLVLPNKRDNFPSIALPFAYLSYPGGYGDHTISIQPLAPGKTFCDFISAYVKAPQKTNELNAAVADAFTTLGLEMGNFQKLFMRPDPTRKITQTISHGDFKCLNVFYDKHFIFIDNETIFFTLDSSGNPMADIAKILFGNYVPGEDRTIRHLLDGVDVATWYPLAVGSFIRGYALAYTVEERAQALQELQELFNSDFSSPSITYEMDKITPIVDTYLNPIFDELKAQ